MFLSLTLCDPMHCSPPGSSVRGIFQARILECITIPLSRGSSLPRDQTQVHCNQIVYHLSHQGSLYTHTHTDFVISMFWYCNYTAKLCKMCLYRRRFNILLQVCISLKNFIENMQMYYYNFLYYAIVTNKNGYDCSKRERDRM